jgi:hypothetical protein
VILVAFLGTLIGIPMDYIFDDILSIPLLEEEATHKSDEDLLNEIPEPSISVKPSPKSKNGQTVKQKKNNSMFVDESVVAIPVEMREKEKALRNIFESGNKRDHAFRGRYPQGTVLDFDHLMDSFKKQRLQLSGDELVQFDKEWRCGLSLSLTYNSRLISFL